MNLSHFTWNYYNFKKELLTSKIYEAWTQSINCTRVEISWRNIGCASLFEKRHFTALFGPGSVYCAEVWPFKIKTLVEHCVSCWETICLSIFLAYKRSNILLLYCSWPLCGYCVSSFNNIRTFCSIRLAHPSNKYNHSLLTHSPFFVSLSLLMRGLNLKQTLTLHDPISWKSKGNCFILESFVF